MSATWASDEKSIDYRHLATALDATPFTFTPDHLRKLAEANRFDFEAGQHEVLFGLRGCTLDQDAGGFGDALQLKEAQPDHKNLRCVVGVWHRVNNKISAFPASTVPGANFMPLQLGTSERKCNLLLTGRYIYTVGNHLEGQSGEMRGVFRQQDDVVVLRSKNDLCYQTTDTFDPCTPGDNVHPSRLPDGEVKFSSEGCTCVRGKYKKNDPQAEWGVLRARAGLGNLDSSRVGAKFVYLLLTGREARLTSGAGSADALKRLRFGSQGDDVKALQTALHSSAHYMGSIHGRMDSKTVMALVARQKQADPSSCDGIHRG